MKGMIRLAATTALVLPTAAVLNAAATSYTVEQATAGKALYGEQCAACHAAGGAAPPLVGGAFARNWSGKSAAELFAKIRDTMPTTNPHSLSENQVASLIAFVAVYTVVFGAGIGFLLHLFRQTPHAHQEGPPPHQPVRSAGVRPRPRPKESAPRLQPARFPAAPR